MVCRLVQHTIAQKILNSYHKNSRGGRFYLIDKILRRICIGVVRFKVVADDSLEKFIELCIVSHIGIHDAGDAGLVAFSCHSIPPFLFLFYILKYLAEVGNAVQLFYFFSAALHEVLDLLRIVVILIGDQMAEC